MKIHKKGIISIAAACFVTAYAADIATIRTETKHYPEQNLTVQKTYRGNQCILIERDENHRKTRSFIVNGKTVAVESDDNGDGIFKSFMIVDPSSGDCEWFTRTSNGLLHPIDSAKFQDLQSKKGIADKSLSDFLQTNQNIKQ